MIVLYPSEILSLKCDIVEYDDSIKNIVCQMIDEMYSGKGLGLAAPQIGIKKRIVVFDESCGEKDDSLRCVINPDIVDSSKNIVSSQEGCLSLPGIKLAVPRHDWVTVSYSDINGDRKTEKFQGLSSIIIQHEIDHLNGITLLDKVNRKSKRAALSIYRKGPK